MNIPSTLSTLALVGRPELELSRGTAAHGETAEDHAAAWFLGAGGDASARIGLPLQSGVPVDVAMLAQRVLSHLIEG